MIEVTDMDLVERFWKKVDKSSDCWEWTAATNGIDYGRFWDGNSLVYAHRFSFSLTNGTIPDGLLICHHCDNPRCVKPSHLFMGTYRDNIRDSMAKGRVDIRGEKHPMSRLTQNDVYEIRRLQSLGVEQSLLAKMWRVSFQHVSDIVRGRRWKHLERNQ